jgi:archaellum component FlaC
LSDVIDQRFERFDDRIGRLEEDVKEIKGDLKAFRQQVAGDLTGIRQQMAENDRQLRGLVGGVEQRLARLEGVVANLPSTWVMLTAIAASQVALLGFTFLILRYAPK